MDMEQLYSYVPRELVTFVLVTLFSLLIGLSQRRISLKREGETTLFGTDRTFTFIGILGYLLYILDPTDMRLFMGGGAVLGLLLGLNYYVKQSQFHVFGVTTIIIALITYCMAPIVATQPSWFYVMVVVTVLLLTELKHTFTEFAQRMKNDEMITLAKFLAISGIILPMLPHKNLIPDINLTPYSIWLATVVVSGISYLSYLLKRYVFHESGTLVSGIIGGLYSSTATISVLDVVSGGEIYTAVQAGFPMEKVHFHGNNKTADEIRFALEFNVGRFVVDNLYELELLNEICGEMGKKANISFRIKPGVDAHTHNFIRTGQIDSKFGFALETGEAFEAVKKAQMYDNVNLTELHCHIGSQIFDIDPFVTAAEIMLDFMGKIHDELGIVISELNLGGGFGIMYTKDDEPVPYENYMEKVSEAVKAKAKEHGLPVPYIFIEPGRSIVGEAGITLYKVGGKKEIPNVRTYVSVDGGMTDNIRYALYQSAYTVVNAGKADKEPDEIVTVAGKCCESGDLVQEHTKVAKVEVGDTLAVLSTGAYNYSMASNYNRIPRPAIVMVKDGKARVVVKRESYEDIVKNDI